MAKPKMYNLASPLSLPVLDAATMTCRFPVYLEASITDCAEGLSLDLLMVSCGAGGSYRGLP
jgi:hypothetical protein